VVSFTADEAWDALLVVKTAEAGTAGAAVPSASSFVLLENENSLFVPRRPWHFSF
jgi:hypothetical protein